TEAIPHISSKIFHTDDSYIQCLSIESLVKLKAKQIIPEITKLLKDEEREVREAAIKALVDFHEYSAIPELVKLLEDADPYIRRKGFKALVDLRAESAIEDIIKLFGKKDSAILQTEVINGLVTLHADSAVPEIINLLKDEDRFVRETAVKALAGLRAESETHNILNLLGEEKELSVQKAAIRALADLQAESAIEHFINLLGKEDSKKLQVELINALVTFSVDLAIPEVIRLLKNKDSFVRKIAIKALADLRAESTIPELISFLDDEDSFVREATIEALADFRDKSITPNIFAVLNDEDWRVQTAAIKALADLRVESAIPQILIFLNDEDWYIQRAAIYAVSNMGISSSGNNIGKFLDNDNMYLQEAAAQALTIMNQPVNNLLDWQGKKLYKTQKYFSADFLPSILPSIFIKGSEKFFSTLVKHSTQSISVTAVESIGIIGEYRAELIKNQVPDLLALLSYADIDLLRATINTLGQIISFRGQEKTEDFSELDKTVRDNLLAVITDQTQNNRSRLGAVDALGATGRQECAEVLYDLLDQFDSIQKKEKALHDRCIYWLGQMAYAPTFDYVKNELQQLEKDKATWRIQRDQDTVKQGDVNKNIRDDLWWQNQEYLLGSTLARIKPETTGINLLNHPLYQIRQGAIRALASRIADGAADATLIGKIIQAHQNFDPDDLPSPFPYAAFQAIDLALWNLEYAGKKDDVTKLKKILKNLQPCQVPGQEGAIKERLEWTIKRLDENLAKNAKLAPAE
ncbi:MAG: HEAT repeat domain-containing protein, partial [Candidatus Electrothrix sp. AR5]|nr:HEAT repeat domain-containing protein [Candidatus Electrothrix sp. AR5]